MGGASTSDPTAFRRWVVSMMMRWYSSPRVRDRRRRRFERKRRRAGEPHRVEYYHQVEDPYSHLAAQVLRRFVDAYDVEVVPHLVGPPPGASAPEPELLLPYSQHDCELVAPHFNLEFPVGATPPDDARIALANRIVARAGADAFAEVAVEVGKALWSHDRGALEAVADSEGMASPTVTKSRLDAGNARRKTLGHYSGAMFYYGGEWYWGVDRLYHLENRLIELGFRRTAGREPLVQRPPVEFGPLKDDGSLTLEIFPSVRSPYSSIVFDESVALAERCGVKHVTRPVLPMVMRGAPVTFAKGRYIFFDTAREAEIRGKRWGHGYDPIGGPVRNAFALFPWAEKQGRGDALVSAFLRMAWYEGVNTNTIKGLRRVVEAAGLDWSEAKQHLQDADWESVVEDNRLAMYDRGIWGVPSYRLLDGDGDCLLSIWGQDRLWLVSRAIQEKLGEGQRSAAGE